VRSGRRRGCGGDRVVCILAGQAANVAISLEALKCPMWSEAPCASNHGITALAIAPFFGGTPACLRHGPRIATKALPLCFSRLCKAEPTLWDIQAA